MSLGERLLKIKSNIRTALKEAGRQDPVEIVAATKTRSFDTIIRAYSCGITSIGENRIQEAEKKFLSFSTMPNMKRRFIGHLQTNKVNKCLDMFDTIDSLDSTKLATKISNRIIKTNQQIECLIEVNTSGDKNKKGFAPDKINEMLECTALENINIVGLMTLGPGSQKEQETRKSFSLLKNIKETLNNKIGSQQISTLSMGMSNDFTIAIEEGSNMLRLGTVLFGPRES